MGTSGGQWFNKLSDERRQQLAATNAQPPLNSKIYGQPQTQADINMWIQKKKLRTGTYGSLMDKMILPLRHDRKFATTMMTTASCVQGMEILGTNDKRGGQHRQGEGTRGVIVSL